MSGLIRLSFFVLLVQSSILLAQHPDSAAVKYLIIFIGDGCGIKQHEATNSYTGTVPEYQSWTTYWVATYYYGRSYDPSAAWSDFQYVKNDPTDSAAGATAPFTGLKTANGKISVTYNDVRLFSLGDKTRAIGRALGSVSSVYLSHATPGAWTSHNIYRGNGYAVADEAFFGHPNTTGTSRENKYTGGKGPSWPPVDVLMGAGHPNWTSAYVNTKIRDKLYAESGQDSKHTLVERIAGSFDGSARLMAAAGDTSVTMLAGLFGSDNLPYRLADNSGYNAENPTLAEMTSAAITVLYRNPAGFALMVEGGAIDWAAHDGYMSKMIGEVIDFNAAIDTAITWVEDSTNSSSWENTLVVVTADHETGYLTPGNRVFPNQPLGLINDSTIAMEKGIFATQIRASWDDADNDNVLDSGESMNWMWNTTGHSNSLVPLWAKGPGADRFANGIVGTDPVRGDYIENTELFHVADYVFGGPNHAPVMTTVIADTTILEDSTLTIAVSGSDPDGNPLYFRAVGIPNVIRSTQVDTLLMVTTDQNWFGEAQVFAIANDGRLEDSTYFTLTVTPVNDPPVWVGLPDTVWLKPGEFDTLLLGDYVNDVDDPDSVLAWNQLICVDSMGPCATIRGDTAFIFANNAIGEGYAPLVVSDTAGATDSAWIVISVSLTAAVIADEIFPTTFHLAQNYPNPFNPTTTIRYGLPAAVSMQLMVFDLLGREVTRLVQGLQQPGFYEIQWEGSDRNGRPVPSGVYFVRIFVPPQAGSTSGYTRSVKMLLLR